MKEIFPCLIGNDVIKNRIGIDIKAGKYSHAYIIEGARGSGKKTVALQIAAALSCENFSDEDLPLPCGVCNQCRKISKGISPDVVWISNNGKASISVEQIREIKTGLYVSPNDCDVRVYIIDQADKMTIQAQNALLLSLEEPPHFVIFILLVEDASRLLETIRSRAQMFRTELFNISETIAYLKGKVPIKSGATELMAAATASAGSLGYAAELIDSDTSSEILKQISNAEKFVRLICRGEVSEIIEFVLGLPIKSAEDIKRILCFTDNAVCDVIFAKKAEKPIFRFFSNESEAFNLSRNIPFAKLVQIHSFLYDAVDSILYNSSPKTVLINFALRIGNC